MARRVQLFREVGHRDGYFRSLEIGCWIPDFSVAFSLVFELLYALFAILRLVLIGFISSEFYLRAPTREAGCRLTLRSKCSGIRAVENDSLSMSDDGRENCGEVARGSVRSGSTTFGLMPG